MAEQDQAVPSFLDVNWDDVPELAPVDEGEHEVECLGSTGGVDKNGNPYRQLILVVPDEPTSKRFRQYVPLPGENMAPAQKVESLNRVRNTFAAFGIDVASQGADFDAIKGQRAWAVLAVEHDPNYGSNNVVKQFIGQR